MFRPNSIRGLLEKRDQKNISNLMEGQEQDERGVFDPEIQDIVDLRCAIKDVDLTIKNLREWKEEQRQNLQRNLKLNKEVFAVEENEKLKKQQVQQNEQVKKFKTRMQKQMQNIQQLLKQPNIKQSDYLNQHEALLINEIVAERVQQCQKRKNQMSKNRELIIDDSKQAFVESLKDMGDIFKHVPEIGAGPIQQKIPIDRNKMKADLEQIERQLNDLQNQFK